jgi:protein involved in polysaccharide export with SLBB domain
MKNSKKLHKLLICFTLALVSFGLLAQNLPSTQLSNTGSMGTGTNGANLGAMGLPNSPNVLRSVETRAQTQTIPAYEFSPLPPNDFQRFVLQNSGQSLPIYGREFFDNVNQTKQLFNPTVSPPAFSASENTPVNPGYILGTGDELVIRGWGSLDIDVRAVIDKSGQINLPKVGSIALAGVKFSHAEKIIDSHLRKLYKNFEISLTMGQLRNIHIYVVGQARRPGNYTLSSQSTLVSALFATGGPGLVGSMRNIQLKRDNQVVTSLDLYSFLAQGNTTSDIKLLDGDIIVIPPAVAYVAISGTVNMPAVYELKTPSENLGQLLVYAAGLPAVADPRKINLERLDPLSNQPRRLIELTMDAQGLSTKLQNGDLITVDALVPRIANSVTLRGAVTKPKTIPWFEGMRIRDLIPSREVLGSSDNLRRKNQLLFDNFELERAQRDKTKLPKDLVDADIADAELAIRLGMNRADGNRADGNRADGNRADGNRADDNSALSKDKTLTESIRRLVEEINFDYALVERTNQSTVSVEMLSFNLAAALDNLEGPDNLTLKPGDVVTVFSASDVRLPLSKRRVNVLIEGEVNRAGIYSVSPGDNLAELISRAGGLTTNAYLFGAEFTREEVQKSQKANLARLITRIENESQSNLTSLAQNAGGTLDAATLQARLAIAKEEQLQTIKRLKELQPSGRIALSHPATETNQLSKLPSISLQPFDRLLIPSKPDFVYVLGSVNTESALLYNKGQTVGSYLKLSGVSSGGDMENIILVRADGSALSNEEKFWRDNKILSTVVMPGDTIVVPEKVNKESTWNTIVRNAKDYTQVLYQLGLGAAAFKSLRN